MTRLLRECSITVLDFETTGSVGGYPIELWQVGAVRLVGGKLDEEQSFRSFIRTGDRPFSPQAPGRHAEFRREILSAPTSPETWLSLRPWVDGQILAAHNVATERKFLTRMAPMHPPTGWIDSLALTRKAFPGEKSYKLEALTVRMGFEPRIRSLCPALLPHDALYDAVACALLIEKILSLESWRDLTLEDIASFAH